MELSKNSARTIVHADRLLNESTMQRKSYCQFSHSFLLGLVHGCFWAGSPRRKGKAEFQHICSNCHITALATRTKHSADEWKSIVDEMVSRGRERDPLPPREFWSRSSWSNRTLILYMCEGSPKIAFLAQVPQNLVQAR